jgi:competence protein ComEA
MATKVRINLANAEELLELPGLGPAQAAAIVRHRADHGPIRDAAELATIP